MFAINWDDYPEIYDNSEKLNLLKIFPEIPGDFFTNPQNLLLEGDNYPLLIKLSQTLKNSKLVMNPMVLSLMFILKILIKSTMLKCKTVILRTLEKGLASINQC